MKIFDAGQLREADKITMERQGITSLELMERAATEVFLWLKRKFPDKETVFHIFCGQGNNGGDGLVIARLLNEDNYKVVVDVVEGAGMPTADFTTNRQKISDAGLECNTDEVYAYKKGKFVMVDAIFGIGLTREPEGAAAAAIARINASDACKISIDVPSGMFLDRKTTLAVQSDVVLTFQYPKLAFFLSDNCYFTKDIVVLDIGLDKEYTENTPTGYFFTDKPEAHARYKKLAAHAHKGTQGHALIIGGSYGKIGAVCLSAKAALRSGCGLVTAYVPKCGYTILQTAFPEAMVMTDGQDHITRITFNLHPSAIGIGMGIGQEPETQKALYDFLKLQQAPVVMDADALNILSYNKEWLEQIPENSILTPHPKELERLMGPWWDDFDKIKKMKAFAAEHNLVLVAKDANTVVVYKDAAYINSTGNAALATAGSGDVLTGIITGLLAQGYNPVDAAIFGVYLHGLTADVGTEQEGQQAFIASDIVDCLGKAYFRIDADIAQK